MKVCQEIDVDNVTIVINQQNQLESQVVIEEVAGLTMPVTLTKDGKKYPVTKVGKLVGTDWLVFQVQEFIPPPTTEPDPTPTKETIRIPTNVLVKDITDPSTLYGMEMDHRVRYMLTHENSAEIKSGKVSSNAVLTFIMRGANGYAHDTVDGVALPASTNSDGEVEFHVGYGVGIPTGESEIESATASGAITVETEDKIYMYELVSPVTVVKRGEIDPTRSFTAEVNCGEYTWEEQPDYRVGTAIQPATVTLSSNDFTADDIQKVTLYTKRLDSEDELWVYETEEISSMVISIPEWFDEVCNPDYVTVTIVEVLLKDGCYVRANVRAECPITKSA